MSACVHCGGALDTSGKFHANGFFGCQDGQTWAEAWNQETLDVHVRNAYDDGYREGYSEAEDDVDRKVDDAYEQAWREARDAVEKAYIEWCDLEFRGLVDLMDRIRKALE